MKPKIHNLPDFGAEIEPCGGIIWSASSTGTFQIAKELLSRDEVELEFGITRRFLELAAWRGDGPPYVKLGRRTVRYRRSDILDFITSKTVRYAK